MAHRLFIGALLVLTASTGFSQSFEKEKLDRYLHTLEANDKFMGNILVRQDGKKVYSFSSGYSNLETKTESHENTLYRIGSVSKTFTATLVLKATEEGKINLSQAIGGYFPSIENAGQITIAQLLNHHSGIHNFTGNADYKNWYMQQKSEEEMVAVIAKGGSDFEPGSEARYSNSNYVLLSYILERIYKKPYEAILNEKIVYPLNLKHTWFGDKAISQKDKANSYAYEVGWNPVEETNLSVPMGAGGIVTTAGDLGVFVDALFGGKLISEEMLDKMKTQTDGYGMGLFKLPFREKTAYGHDGKIDGFTSYFYYFPEGHTVYILLSNAEDYKLDDVNTAVLSGIFNEPFEVPVFNAYDVSAEELTPYLGVYTSKDSPLVITVSGRGDILLAQPRGQQVYTMEATDKARFKHDKSGVTLKFVPQENQMIMKQGEQVLVFTKD